MPVLYCSASDATAILVAMDPSGFAAGSEVTTEEVTTACHDLDEHGITGSRILYNDNTFKILPSSLDVGNQGRLKRAVSYQVAYRRRLGPDHFAGADYGKVSSAGISREGILPAIAPAAMRLLTEAGLANASGGLRTSNEPSWTPAGVDPLFPWLRR